MTTAKKANSTDDDTLEFPVDSRECSAVGRTIIFDEALVIDAAWIKTDKPFIMQGKVENVNGWRHCTIEAVSDDEANLD